MKKNQYFSVIFLIILFLAIPFSVASLKKIQQYLSQAIGIPAKIVVETQSDLGVLPQPWQALAH